nr:ribonuclease H-like domain-containing protein [Tanacetum cinerariifolium]
RVAMYDEYNALVKNSTWMLVSKPPNANVPPGFVDSRFSHHVCYAYKVGFSSSRCDSSLFIYQYGYEVAYLLIYVDDIVLTESSTDLLQRIISSLHKEFDMTDLGAFNYILGISITRDSTQSCRCSQESSLICPWYVRFGLQLYASITGSLVAYTDADWAGCPTTRRSTSGYCVFLRDNVLSWSAKRQHAFSRSSAEAEYRGVANVVAETAWLRNLLRELHTLLLSATLVFCDNVRILYVPSRYQYADILTKGLPSALFEEFRTSLSVRSPPTQTAREC